MCRLPASCLSLAAVKLKGNWKQLKGQIKEQWENLTDDHLDVIAGKRDQLAGKIQEAYGVTKAKADYKIAKEKCDDLAGNPKDVCPKEAKAAMAAAKADAKAQMETSKAN